MFTRLLVRDEMQHTPISVVKLALIANKRSFTIYFKCVKWGHVRLSVCPYRHFVTRPGALTNLHDTASRDEGLKTTTLQA